jgi:hypothetical protein
VTRPRVAIGPVMSRPSWHWVGADAASGAQHCSVQRFKTGDAPQCDLAIWVKERPTKKCLDAMARRRGRVIYCPVDHYESAEQIDADAPMLRQCAAVVVHCERLVPVFQRHARRVECVEHHNRFGLETPAARKTSGPVLWVGSWPFAEYLCRYLAEHRSPEQISLLTEGPDKAQKFIDGFGLGERCRVDSWSVEAQRAALESCRAAIDIKGPTFQQLHKPPVKAQKYVCSGLPFATNRESYSFEYFRKRGFELVEPSNPDRWFSEEYWRETCEVGRTLRGELTLEAVGRRYKGIIDAALG